MPPDDRPPPDDEERMADPPLLRPLEEDRTVALLPPEDEGRTGPTNAPPFGAAGAERICEDVPPDDRGEATDAPDDCPRLLDDRDEITVGEELLLLRAVPSVFCDPPTLCCGCGRVGPTKAGDDDFELFGAESTLCPPASNVPPGRCMALRLLPPR
jgi:hypothetical protein